LVRWLSDNLSQRWSAKHIDPTYSGGRDKVQPSRVSKLALLGNAAKIGVSWQWCIVCWAEILTIEVATTVNAADVSNVRSCCIECHVPKNAVHGTRPPKADKLQTVTQRFPDCNKLSNKIL